MKILIIGAVRAAHIIIDKLGYEAVLLIDKVSASPADIKFPYKKLFVLKKDADVEEYIELAKLLHQKEPFDAVCSFNDTTQAIAIKIAGALSLKFPVSLETLELLYNKNKTRQRLVEANLDDTSFATVRSEAQLNQFMNNENAPVIIKPIAATASNGVIKVESVAEIAPALAKLQQADIGWPLIAESFLDGEEFSVEAISEDGKHKILGVTKKLKDPVTFIELGHVFPAPIEREHQEAIEEFVANALDALGLTDGPSHTEIMLTPKGPRMIETHSRVAGDRIFQLVELSTGIDIFEMVIRQACGQKVLPLIEQKYSVSQFSAAKFEALGFDANTKLQSVDNVEEAESINGVKLVSIAKGKGDLMDEVTDSFSRITLVIATGETADKALKTSEQALKTLRYNLYWEQS